MKLIRNVAIIAHVDHGKTTLVDGLLKQSKTFRENEAEMGQTLIMDSNDQERERGITILAKNTAINFGEYKINIIDTPGHADFGGEVERTLNMADGAILVIDAQEGPMPQTKFVLKKALELGLKIIVVINKIDKRDSRVEEVINKTYDLFLELAQNDNDLEFPIFYAIGRDGRAWSEMPEDFSKGDLTPIFEAIIKYVPEPQVEEGNFQMLVSALDWDNYLGKYAIGKIRRGIAKTGLAISVINGITGEKTNSRLEKIFVNQGLKRIEANNVESGDIIAVTGIKQAGIGDTICDALNPEQLPTIKIDEPTLRMAFSANTSPFSGKEGKFCTGRQLLERIQKELETNVSLKLEYGETGEYVLSGRGELHLSVFIETLRREGYELQVGKPQVITKEIDGIISEPHEELTVDVENQYVANVISELGRRKALLISQSENTDTSVRLVFETTTRGLLGLRSRLLTLSRGTAVMNTIFLKYSPMGDAIGKLRNGVLVSSETGKAVSYGLEIAQGRGITFIPPQTEVYEGMIIGLNAKDNDLDINVTKEKKMTNCRSNAEIGTILTPATILSLEQCIDFIEDDELLEVTPLNLRLRKKILNSTMRQKANK